MSTKRLQSLLNGPVMRVLRAVVGVAALAVIAVLLALPSLAPHLLRYEHWTADWRTSLLAAKPDTQIGSIALVAINNDTLANYVNSPIDRGLLAQIVTAVDAANPRVIGLDILFLKRTEADKDEALISALKNARATVVLGAIDERGDLKPYQSEFQQEFLTRAGRPAGFLNLHYDHDGVVRYTASPEQGKPRYPKSFARLLAESGGAAAANETSRPIPWLAAPRDGTSTFLTLPAQDLIADASKGAQLAGRVVMIGGDFPLRDRHRVPQTTRTGDMATGLAIHAQIVAGLLDPKRAISELDRAVASTVLLAVATLGFAVGWSLWSSGFVPYLGAGFATGLLLLVDIVCFKGLNVLLPFTTGVAAWVAGMTAGSSLRYIFAPKRRTSP